MRGVFKMPDVDNVTAPTGAGAVYTGNSADPRNQIALALAAAATATNAVATSAASASAASASAASASAVAADAAQSADNAALAANGAIAAAAAAESSVAEVPALRQELAAVASGHVGAQTLAALQAITNKPVQSIGEVLNDGVNNGLYSYQVGGWVKSTYDPMIKIAALYQVRPVITSNTSLNSYLLDGDYYGASGLTLLDVPTDFYNTAAFILTTRTVTDNTRFVLQTIFMMGGNYGRRWDRFLDKNDMSGAWVAVNYLADASVTAPKIADLAVNNAKLSADNQYVATLTSVSLNAALKQGLYIVVTCTNAPSGLSSGLMRVDSYNGGSYQVQTIVDLTDASKCYSRTTRPNQSTPVYNAWADVKGGADAVNGSRLTDKTVTNAKLSDYYAYNSSVSTGSFNDLYRQGSYVIAGVLADAPSDGPASGLLIVDALNGGSYVIQRLHQINKPERVWTRQIRPASGTPSFGVWLYMGLDQIKTHAQYFADKRMVCFGDSVTEFGDYPARLAARLGLAEAVNVGFGGCRMAVHESVKYDAMSMYRVAQTIASQNFTNLELRAQQLYDEDGDDNRAIVARLKAVNFANVNYITIFYGQNDFAADIPIGTPSDNTGATFWGAINVSLNAILTAYPHIKITLVAPYWRARQSSGDGLESDVNPNDIGKYLIDYVDALIAAGIKYKLPVVDMYRSSGINSYTAATYLTDGLHPTLPAGYQLIADKLAINF